VSLAHESFVAARFDALRARFRAGLEEGDYRFAAVRRALGPVEGLRLLDLGCGKGRFAARLAREGAEVVGLDRSPGMLAEAAGLARVLGTAARLPFPDAGFDGVLAVEVLQHLPARGLDRAIAEACRVLRPGGRLALVDRNLGALDPNRPWLPRLLVKRIDEHRGLWMYRPGEPARERWFAPARLARRLARHFERVRVEHLLAPEEAGSWVFRRVARARSMTLWTARRPGGDVD
jgi:2-polyprenyl-6-hydroxyphenyl methylase/3-demethylubiquinone-9 3-methyltransferase